MGNRLRLGGIPLLVLIVACVAGVGALTDKPHVKLSDAAPVVRAHGPWNATIEISRRGRGLDGFSPIVTIGGPRGEQSVRAKDLGNGRYRVSVRLPHGGFYSYTLRLGNRVAARGTIYAIPR